MDFSSDEEFALKVFDATREAWLISFARAEDAESSWMKVLAALHILAATYLNISPGSKL